MLTTLQKRCVEISYKHKLTHVSSVMNTVNVLAEIYVRRGKDDPVCLGNSHAALALFVVLESVGLCDAEEMLARHGTHAARDLKHGVYVSGGSLGQVETISLGLAMAEPDKTVWLVTSDGACMEGSVYEAMRIARHHALNLRVFVIYNGTGAYTPISLKDLPTLSCSGRIIDVSEDLPKWLRGVPGHYLTLNAEQYSELMT